MNMNSFNFSKSLFVIFLLIATFSLINQSRAVCFARLGGCLDNNVQRKNGDIWERNCYRCECRHYNYTLATCYEPYTPNIFESVKKTIDNNIVVQANLEKDDSVEIRQTQVYLEKTSGDFECPDSQLLGGENTLYQLVEYITEIRETSCCSIGFRAVDVSPDCKVINIDECKVDVVDKETGGKCEGYFGLVG